MPDKNNVRVEFTPGGELDLTQAEVHVYVDDVLYKRIVCTYQSKWGKDGKLHPTIELSER